MAFNLKDPSTAGQGLIVSGLRGSTVTIGSTEQYQQMARMLSTSDQYLSGTSKNVWAGNSLGLPDPARAIWSAGTTDEQGYGLRVARPLGDTTVAVQSKTGGGDSNSSSAWGIGIGVGGTIVASLINAMGAASAAKYLAQGQNAMLEAQAHVAENNAKLFENQAVIAKAAAEWKLRKVTAQYGEEKAKMKAGMAANGVAIGGAGTSAEMLASNDLYKAIDKRQAAINAVAEAWGFKSRASSARNAAWAARAGKGSPSQIGLSAGAVAFTSTMKPLFERGLSLSLGVK